MGNVYNTFMMFAALYRNYLTKASTFLQNFEPFARRA